MNNWRLVYLDFNSPTLISARMCKRGPKLTVARHIPNCLTTFGRNFECEMVFASSRLGPRLHMNALISTSRFKLFVPCMNISVGLIETFQQIAGTKQYHY